MLYLQTIIDGLMQGGVYAMVALGLSLVFGVMRIINWSHGETLMAAMYISFLLYSNLGINPYLTILVNIIIFAIYGYFLQRMVLNGLLKREADREPLSILLFTAGLGMVLSNGALMIFGAQSKAIAATFNLGSFKTPVLDLVISKPKLIAFIISIAVTLALFAFIKRAEYGRALRACSQNRHVAVLMGIDQQKLYGIAMAIGCALVGIAGALLISFFPVTPDVGSTYSMKSFIIVVLGGKGSILGALVGGLIVGVIETLGAQLTSASYSQVILFVLFIVILLVRPSGLLGQESE
ncbi:MAG: branched-chain amino acid ABC transporter permease [Saccharofermentanales bacterium]